MTALRGLCTIKKMRQSGNSKLRAYAMLAGLGFSVAIAAGLMIYVQFRGAMLRYSDFTSQTYAEYVAYLYENTMANMLRHIEQRYPVLRDVERLKREAASPWFWEMSAQWTETASIFGFAYIYYMEKTDGAYRFLMSSGIGPDKNPEWLGKPVWQKQEPPDYIERAWETRQPAFSSGPVTEEWGTLISAALPIVVNGEVAGMLGVDYDVSFLDSLQRQEGYLNAYEDTLLWDMGNTLATVMVVIIVLMGIMLFFGWRLVRQSTEADSRVRLMIDATPLICSFWDEAGVMLDCNLEALNIFGLKEKADYIEHFYELTPEVQPDGEPTRAKAARLINAAFQTGSQRFEWMYHTAAGEPLPVETTLVRVPWEQGFRLAAYSRDLREIKAREAAAREVEERLRVMLDTMAFAAFFFDAGGNPIDCNQQALALYGCRDKKEFLGDFFSFSPEYQPDGERSVEKAREYIRRAFKTGKEVFRWEHRKADRTSLPAEITLIRVDWNGGHRIVAYARDLTSLRETEDNLRRILSVVEGSPNFTFYISADGDIEYLNPAVSWVTGLSREALLTDGLERMFSPEDFQRLGEYFAEALEKKRMVNFEMGVFDKEGRRRDFSFSAFSTRLHGGITGVGILGREITELKRIQRDLTAARDQAERALALGAYYHQAKNDFLSRVSHEMRTPMNAIIGMTALVRKAPDERERRQSLDKIDAASKRLLDIVNDILDITGFDTGGFNWDSRPFSFSGTMAQIIDAAAAKARIKQQRFVTDIDRRIPGRLVSDERRLQQVLSRLLSNAVKFTAEKGEIGLSAALIDEAAGECVIRFEVSDTGIGIPKEEQERLWDVFEQEDNSITRKYGGMGLGLPLIRRIVELMKGSIRLESEPGKGSRFICEVRLGRAQDAEQNGSASPDDGKQPPAPPSSAPDLKDLRALVVDDVDINREILFAMLQETGADYDGADNGEEAVRLFSQIKYDLVLMDLHMPVMNGLDAARAMRDSSRPWARTIPIISVSADTSADIHSKCLAAGINSHIAKPVDMEILFQAIRKWIPARPPAAN